MPLSEQQLLNMEKRRKSILEAATILFATDGYEGTTVKNIATKANVSFGSVFTYFKDKEELFYNVVTEPLKAFKEQVLAFYSEAENPLQEIREMIAMHIRLFAGINHYLTLVTHVVGQHQKYPSAFKELDEFHDAFRKKVSHLVENGHNKGVLIQQDPLTVATLYTSLLIGIRMNSTDNRYEDMWDHYAFSVINLFGPVHKEPLEQAGGEG